MSAALINHSPDLKRLRDEGYSLEIRKGYLLVHDVPYVTPSKQVSTGTLVSVLTLANSERTAKPDNHICYFIGEYPHQSDGKPIASIYNNSNTVDLVEKLTVNHLFSAKPEIDYPDYYIKLTTYIAIISSEAQIIEPNSVATTFRVVEEEPDNSVFGYLDTNSSRAKIIPLNEKVAGQKIAIIGLGGTGAYTLDNVAKTPVAEIHLFDGDLFLQHNAFRAPGAATIEDLKGGPTKVAYYAAKYGDFHKGIVPHPVYITEDNVHLLKQYNFIFICIDKPPVKKFLFRALVDMCLPFVDTGMDVERTESGLMVMIRVTAANATMHNHLPSRVSFADDDANHEYDDNIQIAELNMLNAAMAVIRWKRMFGFYTDLEQEYHTLYSINQSHLVNDDIAT